MTITLYVRRFAARARTYHRFYLVLLCLTAFCMLFAVSVTAAALVGPVEAY